MEKSNRVIQTGQYALILGEQSVANKLLVCIVLLFLLPCAERGVWCMHSPYTVMTFPQYNQREKWTRIPEKKAKEQKGIV